MINKVILLVFDGLGDRPIPAFGGKTPLEAAYTPNLDAIAAVSQCGLMHTLGRGVRPGSDVAHLAIFGYDRERYYTGRGPIEAAGLGIPMQEGDIALRGNFATVDGALNIVDRRAGRIRDVSEFAAVLDGMEIDGVQFIVKPGTAHRAGVILRGNGLSPAVSDSDPHEAGQPVWEVKPLDGTAEADFTAAVLNKFGKKAYEILSALPENKKRQEAGKPPANFLLLRGAGVYPSIPKFNDKYGLKACCIAGGGLYKGVGAFLGMDVLQVQGATALPNTDIGAKLDAALKALFTYDFVFVHIKAADSLAEDGDFMGKRMFIEKADRDLARLRALPDNVLLIITADHSTSCALKAHTADPVPVIFCNPDIRIDDVEAFGEQAAAKGGLGFIEGKDIMPEVLNLMGRLPLTGA
jgi:2,3-bisphosphoglycerate-independent phosphoglycerate mutase